MRLSTNNTTIQLSYMKAEREWLMQPHLLGDEFIVSAKTKSQS